MFSKMKGILMCANGISIPTILGFNKCFNIKIYDKTNHNINSSKRFAQLILFFLSENKLNFKMI